MQKAVAFPRRALCLGVKTFTLAEQDDIEEPELTPFEPLEYAGRYTDELRGALEAAGYTTDLITDPARLKADELGEHVERHLDGGGVAVVHVLSHGERTQRGGVYVIGADATKSKRTRVEDWTVTVADNEPAPLTLFLLDLCHAGAANRHWEPPEAGTAERAWVIAAAGADQPAYAGRLTRAATTVINEIASGRADLAETLPFVPFDVLYERIKREVKQLTELEQGFPQDVVCTPRMGSYPELPFFANPSYRPSPVAEATAKVDLGTAGLVDALDAEHFRDRAAGRGPVTARVSAGCFTGRGPQLRRLVEWIDGDDPIHQDGAGGGLVVVTGSPGVGKSALLGVLVCAAHPQLREATYELWRHAAARPSQNSHLAAVYARQRNLEEVIASLGRQLLDSDGAPPRSPQELIAVIAARAVRPVIVLDALDEAVDYEQILDQLLLPLAAARRPDGSPTCRLLVGTRPWDEFAPLLEIARKSGEVIDLDAIPPEQRRRDIADYVGSLLELMPDYADTTYRHGRRAFADAVAASLIPDPQPDHTPQPGPAGHEDTVAVSEGKGWGEFLVASLYTHTITHTYPDQLADRDAAARLGAAVPRTLPEVLELDLKNMGPDPRWLRSLLTALAHARGAGIPRAVLPAVIAALAEEPAPPSVEQVADELEQLRFYLRTGADTDGAALYRWFHQSLAEHLRASPSAVADAQRLLNGLLATVPLDDRDQRRWDLAFPYLLRHGIQHAALANRVDELLTDPGFLVYADPTTLIPNLHLAVGTEARLAAAIYRASAAEHPNRTPSQRRDVLAIDAARYGARHLRDSLSMVSPAARLRPAWATGSRVNAALFATMTARDATAMACTVVDGRPVAVTGGWDGAVWLWDLRDRARLGGPLTGHSDAVASVACTVVDGRPVAVTGGRDEVPPVGRSPRYL